MAAGRLELASSAARSTLEQVREGDESALSMLETEALGTAQAAIASSSDAVAMLRLAAQAGGATWTLAETRGAPLDVILDGCEIDVSHLTGYRWLRSFWIATLARDERTRTTLLDGKLALEGPRRHTQAFELHFIDAIRVHARGGDASQAIAAAYAATTSSQLEEDWIDRIDRPKIKLAGHIFARDAKLADQALNQRSRRTIATGRARVTPISTTSHYAPEAVLTSKT